MLHCRVIDVLENVSTGLQFLWHRPQFATLFLVVRKHVGFGSLDLNFSFLALCGGGGVWNCDRWAGTDRQKD